MQQQRRNTSPWAAGAPAMAAAAGVGGVASAVTFAATSGGLAAGACPGPVASTLRGLPGLLPQLRSGEASTPRSLVRGRPEAGAFAAAAAATGGTAVLARRQLMRRRRRHAVLRHQANTDNGGMANTGMALVPEAQQEQQRFESLQAQQEEMRRRIEQKRARKAGAQLVASARAAKEDAGPRLPRPWKRVAHPTTPGEWYYYNEETGQTQWDLPAHAPAEEATAEARDAWKRVQHGSSGEFYYYNETTGETRWEMPAGFEEKSTKTSESSGAEEGADGTDHEVEDGAGDASGQEGPEPEKPSEPKEAAEPQEIAEPQHTSVEPQQAEEAKEPAESTETEEPTGMKETAEPQETSEPEIEESEEAAEPQEISKLQDIVAPQETLEPQQTMETEQTVEPQEMAGQQETAEAQPTAEPREVAKPTRTATEMKETAKLQETEESKTEESEEALESKGTTDLKETIEPRAGAPADPGVAAVLLAPAERMDPAEAAETAQPRKPEGLQSLVEPKDPVPPKVLDATPETLDQVLDGEADHAEKLRTVQGTAQDEQETTPSGPSQRQYIDEDGLLQESMDMEQSLERLKHQAEKRKFMFQARREVFVGERDRTPSGLSKDDLMLNRAGRVVSKAKSMAAKQRLRTWWESVKAAKEALNISGFQIIGGETEAGQELYRKAREIYDGSEPTDS
mmetsp:Transcript_52281/g.167638  ORF Transcript_52281/g.167638 Transcript_52281/m.167638 type:complete len:683 (+) Transcript_52281:76-2124(+)